MTTLKEQKLKLSQYGYSHHWKLIKHKDVTRKSNDDVKPYHLEFYEKISKQITKPLCQNIDLIVPSKKRNQKEEAQLEQFFNIIGTELHEQKSQFQKDDDNDSNNSTPSNVTKEFKQDDEKRHYRIEEFIKTEQSYVETLKTLVERIVNPLRSAMQQKNCILSTFKFQKIFLNIDQILRVNQDFLNELLKKEENFGELCRKHITQFECYRKYLLEQSEAQKLHTREYKSNQAYKRFITRVKDHPDFKRKRLQDILVEPVQRISRYSLMLRGILQLTPKYHPEYNDLQLACEKAREIATLADDNPTKTATMLLNLYQAIKDSPCSLINQKRSLIAHLDAIEIHRVTNKPTRAVSIFLFTDRILVASRPSVDAKEINLEQILNNSNPICPTNSISSSTLFSSTSNLHHHLNLTKSDKPNLRFKGWADIASIEFFDGVPERPGSFILSATNVPEIKQDEVSSITSFEKYFYKGPRIFTVIPNSIAGLTRQKRDSYFQKVAAFKELYQQAKAFMKRYDVNNDRVFYKLWGGVPTFCNTYTPDTYLNAKFKNDTALIYVDDPQLETEQLFSRRSPLYNPWIIGLIQPEDMKGFRFQVCTRINFPTYKSSPSTQTTEQTIDFENIFWNNIYYLNQCLKATSDYATQTLVKIQESILSHPQQRHRSRSMTRPPSVSTIGKLFSTNSFTASATNVTSGHRSISIGNISGNDGITRSRSVSPTKMLNRKSNYQQQGQLSPSSSLSTASYKRPAPVHHSWSGSSASASGYRHHRRDNSDCLSQNSSITSISSSITQPSHHDLLQTPSNEEEHHFAHYASSQYDEAIPVAEEDTALKHAGNNKNTISSLGSGTSGASSFSMIEDELGVDEEDDVEVDYLTLDIDKRKVAHHRFSREEDRLQSLKHISPMTSPNLPTPAPTPPDESVTQANASANNRSSRYNLGRTTGSTSTVDNLSFDFKSILGFEDEMQQQWNNLISKYEL